MRTRICNVRCASLLHGMQIVAKYLAHMRQSMETLYARVCIRLLARAWAGWRRSTYVRRVRRHRPGRKEAGGPRVLRHRFGMSRRGVRAQGC